MPAPNKVARKLTESLGSEASDAMVDWLNGVEESTREVRADIAELRQEMTVQVGELRQEMKVQVAELRQEMRGDFASVREEMRGDFASVRGEMRGDFASVREEMRTGFAKVDARFAEMNAAAAQRHADFMKWTLGFWGVSLVTLVAAIATLSRMLP